MGDVINVFSVTSGSSFLEYTTTGSGYPRLFEGDGLYVYRLRNDLLVSRDGAQTFVSIMPSQFFLIAAMCQVYGNDKLLTEEFPLGGQQTLAFSTSSLVYQATPESIDEWRSSGSLPDIYVSDAIADSLNEVPPLVGNYVVSAFPRVLRCTDAPPFNDWSQSDSGLPTGASNNATRITDLEISD